MPRIVAGGSKWNHAEGRIAWYFESDAPLPFGIWQSEHALRDHLGNTRLTFADKNNDGHVQALDGDKVYLTDPPTDAPLGYTEILQENHYYPFGQSMETHWMNELALDSKYQYNWKAWNEPVKNRLNILFLLHGKYELGSLWAFIA